MANPLLSGKVRVIGKEIVDAKLLHSAPTILAENRAMVTQMLDFVKAELIPETPSGPGHFGYHLRDRYRTEVRSAEVSTTGTLKAPPQGYWREFGTRGNFAKSRSLSLFIAATGGGSGERAGFFAHRALGAVKRFLAFYYGKQQWWRL